VAAGHPVATAILAGVAAALWLLLLVVLGIWRHVRQHWPLTYEPALWSVVFPLGMYSVATLAFGKVAHLAFMEPLSRFMLWVAVAAWIAVAGALVTQLRDASGFSVSGNHHSMSGPM
jgi:tellurite resistance protein TehA-like permease